MDYHHPRKSISVNDGGTDLISQLPADIKDKILERLCTVDAARTALLSTQWKDVWLQHGRLVFDVDFFFSVKKFLRRGNKSTGFINLINNILSFRAGPVKKFTLDTYVDHNIQQHDLDRWCLFLSRNGVEELSLYIRGVQHKLPSCIVSCPTIKQLKLESFCVVWPANARCIFPGVTSLVFDSVVFEQNVNGIVPTVPNLEKLTLCLSDDVDNFQIDAPRLKCVIALCPIQVSKLRWFTLNLESIETLSLSCDMLSFFNTEASTQTIPAALNLQVLKLHGLNFAWGKDFGFVLQLLQKSPKLSELEIVAKQESPSFERGPSRLLEDSDVQVFDHDLKMLNTVKIESFSGSIQEINFLKAVLSKSPILEKVFIHKVADMHSITASNISRKLYLHCASPKVQIFFMEYQCKYKLMSPSLRYSLKYDFMGHKLSS